MRRKGWGDSMQHTYNQASSLLGPAVLLLSCILNVLFLERFYVLAVFLLLLGSLTVNLTLDLIKNLPRMTPKK